MTDTYKYGNDLPRSIKRRKLFDYLRKYQVYNKEPTPYSYLDIQLRTSNFYTDS
jgi:hypothetical protein